MHKRHSKKKKIVCIILVLNILLLSFVIVTDGRLRRVLTQSAITQSHIIANTLINSEINRIIEEEGIEYNDISTISRDADGKITSVTLNTITVNHLKTAVVGKIQEAILQYEDVKVEIRFGTIIGNEYLAGRGPKLHFNMNMAAAVLSDLKSEFSSAGINQTLHRVTLLLDCKIYLHMPWYHSSTNLKTQFLVAETVIVGQVPDAYTNVIETPANDIAGILNDFSAEVIN